MTRMVDNGDEAAGCIEEYMLEEFHQRLAGETTRRQVQAHLETCEPCRSFLEDIVEGEQMGELLREARRETPAELRARLIEFRARLLPRKQ